MMTNTRRRLARAIAAVVALAAFVVPGFASGETPPREVPLTPDLTRVFSRRTSVYPQAIAPLSDGGVLVAVGDARSGDARLLRLDSNAEQRWSMRLRDTWVTALREIADGGLVVGAVESSDGEPGRTVVTRLTAGGAHVWTLPFDGRPFEPTAMAESNGRLVIAATRLRVRPRSPGTAALVLGVSLDDGKVAWRRNVAVSERMVSLNDVLVGPGGTVYVAGRAATLDYRGHPLEEGHSELLVARLSQRGLVKWVRTVLPREVPGGGFQTYGASLLPDGNGVLVAGSSGIWFDAQSFDSPVQVVLARFSPAGARRGLNAVGEPGANDAVRLIEEAGHRYLIEGSGFEGKQALVRDLTDSSAPLRTLAHFRVEDAAISGGHLWLFGARWRVTRVDAVLEVVLVRAAIPFSAQSSQG